MNISIIVPVYNAELYLERCLNSLVNQSFGNFEIVVINDGSTDKSAEICENFKKEYSNIVLVHKENGGSASARNLGLSIAKGAYIAFVDADDFVDTSFLEVMYNLAVKKDADLVQCNYKSLKDIVEFSSFEKNIERDIKTFNNIEMLERFCNKKEYLGTAVLWNKLIKRERIEGLSFVEGKGIDDEYIIHEILYRTKKCVVTSEILYFYVLTEGSQMRSEYTLKRLDSIDVIEKQLDFFIQINQFHLYNLLQYRYLSSILMNYYYIKKFFSEETLIIEELKEKRKLIYSRLLLKEISLRDKILLLIKRYIPGAIELVKN